MFRSSLWPGARNLNSPCPKTIVRSASRGLASRSSSSPSAKGRASNGAAQSSPPHASTGWGQLKSLRNHGIGLSGDLTRLQIDQGRKNLGFRIAPYHCIKRIEQQWFTETGHPKGLLIAERCYDHDKTKPLWKATLVTGGLAIVRGKAKARINMALMQALRNMGYDRDGRKVDPTKPSDPAWARKSRHDWRKEIVELYGTLHIHSQDALDILNQPFADLRGLCERAVFSMEGKMGRTTADKQTKVSGRPSVSDRSQGRDLKDTSGMRRVLDLGADSKKRGPPREGRRR